MENEKERQIHIQTDSRTNGVSAIETSEVRTVDERFWLHDMGYLYDRSFNELEKLFRSKFKKSKVFQDMILELYESNIEYKFL